MRRKSVSSSPYLAVSPSSSHSPPALTQKGVPSPMEYTHLTLQRRFSDEKMQKVSVFETEKMFFDQYCLLPGQSQKVHSHEGEDKVYLVLEGEAVFDIGGEQEMLTEGTAVIARAGVPHGVRNDSGTKLVLLVTMAPRPQ